VQRMGSLVFAGAVLIRPFVSIVDAFWDEVQNR
jgi:hypothetical protein